MLKENKVKNVMLWLLQICVETVHFVTRDTCTVFPNESILIRMSIFYFKSDSTRHS